MIDFSTAKNIFLGISMKADGNMRLTDAAGRSRPAAERESFLARQGLDNKNAVAADLAHGHKVAIASDADKGKIIAACDALITDRPGVILTLTVADCLPIYFYDPRRKAAALAHAGWQGTAANIAGETVEVLAAAYNSAPADIEVFIGPHIGKCHFEVRADVAEKFAAYPEFIHKNDKMFIDLAGIAKSQLIRAGVPAANINISPECTYCLPDKYFSYRRERAAELQTMISYIVIK